MFFYLSKIFWAVAQPLSLSFLLVLLGWVLVLFSHTRSGSVAIFLGLLVISSSSITTLGFQLIRPLEERFARPGGMPETISTIIMLGGATSGRVSTARGIAELTDAADRLTETLRLASLYPEARIVLSGGRGILFDASEPEAVTAERFFLAMGIAADRLILEDESRNTDENADRTAELLLNQPGPIILITSAFHMPRSVGLFRASGIDIVPWPVDYRSSGTEGYGLDLANPLLNLNVTGIAIREWLGLAAYKLTGRIEQWFPGPA